MKKALLSGSMMLLASGMAGVASASLVNFDLAGNIGGSYVSVLESAKFADLVGELALPPLEDVFTLNDGEYKVVDFFTLEAGGWAILGKSYTLEASLAFDLPSSMVVADGSGGGKFFTYGGFFSGGTVTWTDQPNDVVLADGNTISVIFENGCTVGIGGTAMVNATIKKLGGGTTPANAPVPEPASMFLFGIGLVGFAGFNLKRMKK